jgi:hypothetical protein
MVRLVRPGGWVTGEEADAILVCYPRDEAGADLRPAAGWRLADADISIGRRLPEMYRTAGLHDIGFRVYADAHPAGHRRRMIVPDLVRSLRPKIIRSGLITERELDELDAAAPCPYRGPEDRLAPCCTSRLGQEPVRHCRRAQR